EVRAHRLDFLPPSCPIEADVPNLHRVTGDFGSERPQKQLCKCASSNASCRFSRRSTLQNVTRIMKIELLRTGKVCMSGAWRDEFLLLAFKPFGIFHGQSLFPVGPVAIFDAKRDRRANRLAMSYAGENLRAVPLDLLAAPAPVAQLPAVQLVIDEIDV